MYSSVPDKGAVGNSLEFKRRALTSRHVNSSWMKSLLNNTKFKEHHQSSVTGVQSRETSTGVAADDGRYLPQDDPLLESNSLSVRGFLLVTVRWLPDFHKLEHNNDVVTSQTSTASQDSPSKMLQRPFLYHPLA